jgi:hypothetical protein
LEVLTTIFRQFELQDLVRVALTCKLFRHGGLETMELPTESPMVAVLLDRAFARLELAPRMRPSGCSETWMAYLARCVRQGRCRETPPIAVSDAHSLFLDAAGRLLVCGPGPHCVTVMRAAFTSILLWLGPWLGFGCGLCRPDVTTAWPFAEMVGSTHGFATRTSSCAPRGRP